MGFHATNLALFDQLRKMFPQIPEKCTWLKIAMQADRPPTIECGFLTEHAVIETQEFEIVAKQTKDQNA